ncbi:MAG: hypothetical protein GX442_20530 [Candidatus Riflebacteria bacterium]|nr:hypothetical protein [Candidatus Riflebacteria bacterium]
MAPPPLGFMDYLWAAFDVRWDVPGLGKMPVNKMALAGVAILGLANPGFWFVGAALEVTFLWMTSTDARFQRYVQANRMNVVSAAKNERLQAMMATLDRESTKRLETLNLNLSEINRLMDMSSEGTVQFVKETKQQTLAQLPTFFLKLLVTRRLICQSLERTDVDKLKTEIKDLTRQLDTPDLSEALGKSLRGTIEIQQRRLDNIRRAQENLKLVEMELNRIENQVQLIREEIALDRSPDAITAGIDRINATLGETAQFMDSHSEFLTRINDPAVEEGPLPIPPANLERQ